jgi:mRNA interferase RelE/StbE
MPSQISQRIEKVIDELETNPYLGSKMHGELSHLRKIRVSDYRIIYQIFESKIVIEILEIQSRGNVLYDR